jgi:hypothetical protein
VVGLNCRNKPVAAPRQCFGEARVVGVVATHLALTQPGHSRPWFLVATWRSTRLDPSGDFS